MPKASEGVTVRSHIMYRIVRDIESYSTILHEPLLNRGCELYPHLNCTKQTVNLSNLPLHFNCPIRPLNSHTSMS